MGFQAQYTIHSRFQPKCSLDKLFSIYSSHVNLLNTSTCSPKKKKKKNRPKKILSKIHKFHKSVQISHISFIKKSIQYVQITDKIYSNFIHKLHKKICSTCLHIKSVQPVQIHSNFIINMSNLFTHKKSIQISSFHSPCKKVL